MATNLAIDDRLINDAVRLGGHKSKKAAVTAALESYIRQYRQQKILELFGAVDYDPDYDYKAQRKRQ
jgi:Arc/MetJ family transcription regulator